jgi:hypothetical protein
LQQLCNQKDDLLAGRTPRKPADGCTVKYVVNRFLAAKEQRRNLGEWTARWLFVDFRVGTILVEIFGKKPLVVDPVPENFDHQPKELAKTCGPGACPGGQTSHLGIGAPGVEYCTKNCGY